MGSIRDCLNSKDNALNLLRLVLAGLVIVSHSAPIGGFGEEFKVGGLTLGNIAVGGFFAVSGFLITSSRFGSDLLPYLWRRFLRIFPGYWGCLAVVGFVFSAISATTRSGWTPQTGLSYFWSNALMVFSGDSLSSTLTGAPFAGTWNGSLWTLRYELACYIIVGFVISIAYFRVTSAFFTVCFLAVTVLSIFVNAANIRGLSADVGFLMPFFAAGAWLFRFRSRIPSSGRLAAAALVALLLILIAGAGRSLAALPVAYLCMWIGIALPPSFRRIGRRNDLSYGLYLYGFPVQQLLVFLGANALGLPIYVLLSILATLPMAAMSWFLIESPSMRLKRLVGARPRAKVGN